MPSAMASTASVNSSREPSRATTSSSHGTSARPGDDHEHGEDRGLAEARGRSATEQVDRRSRRVPRRRPPRSGAIVGQEHEDDDREQVLDDQPADGDPPLRRVELVAVRRARAAGRRCWRPRSPGRGRARRRGPSRGPTPSQIPSSVATTIWTSAPGIAIARTASRSRIEKWMPTPNISRIDAELGELRRDAGVGD